MFRENLAAAPRRLRKFARFRKSVQLRFGPWLGIHVQYPPRALKLSQVPCEIPAPVELPIISVVTPSYNHGQFLERTIRSVVEQDYLRLEYVVQDGASTDQTRSILVRYGDRLAYWDSRPDRGQTHAINLGFAHTEGEIMAYLNSDDLLMPGALRYVGMYFHDHPEVDVVYGHRIVIDEHDREIGRWILPAHRDSAFVWEDYIPQETLFWRRRLWDRIGGRLDEDLRFAMDWDLLLRFHEAGARFERLPHLFGLFRCHSEQKSLSQYHDVGQAEIKRLRREFHGREVTRAELRRNVLAYRLEHAVYQQLHKLGRFPK